MEEMKRKRAERFGIPVVESKPDPPTKGKGKGGGGGGGGGKVLSEEDKARIAAREARFGKVENTSGKRKVEEVKQAAPVDPEEEERRKKRAARFGLPA